MCGIAGGIGMVPGAKPDVQRVRRMTELLAHRGPDDAGVWVSPSGRAVLGHRRLSVIDVAAGAQPMIDETGRFAIVFNGEIYNYRELRRPLENAGVPFRTASDTEVLLRLLQRDGAEAVHALTGMFAFAFWDELKGELLLVRDRIGEKPLYHEISDGCLYFASGFRPLTDTRAGKPALDPRAVTDFLTLGYVPAPRTIAAGVSKLEAGTALLARSSGVTVERYWSIAERHDVFTGCYEAAVDVLDDMLAQAVRLRLRSDVPLGVFLSGGVDSSLVAALAARQADELQTFSIGFDEAGHDESEIAADVARRIGARHHVFHARLDLLDSLPQLVRHYGEPFGDPSALPLWLLAERTRRHVTVAVGGDGGDEAFAGYDWYATAARLARLRRFMPVAAAGASLNNGFGRRVGSLGRIGRALVMVAAGESGGFAAQRCFVDASEAARLYGDPLLDAYCSPDGPRQLLAARYRDSSGSALRRMRDVDIQTYLADCLMPKVDVATMAHGLEARAPLLDHDLITFALSLPDSWLFDASGQKRILKDVLFRYLPKHLYERPKQGFAVPLQQWFRTGLRDRVERLPLSEPLRATGWLRTAGLHSLVHEHLTGKRGHGQRIYNLIVLEEWLRQWAL